MGISLIVSNKSAKTKTCQAERLKVSTFKRTPTVTEINCNGSQGFPFGRCPNSSRGLGELLAWRTVHVQPFSQIAAPVIPPLHSISFHSRLQFASSPDAPLLTSLHILTQAHITSSCTNMETEKQTVRSDTTVFTFPTHACHKEFFLL